MHCQTMGVVNVTPDSFVSEIRTPDLDAALERCRKLVAAGADILDIGGESTRPGATPISLDEELARVIPVVAGIAPELPASVRISIDTRHASVARAAVEAGAAMINDMSASLGAVAAELRVEFVAAHMQGTPRTMQTDPDYEDVIVEVLESMVIVAAEALEAGAPRVWIDPGIGFGKSHAHNLALLAHIDRFVASPHPVLIGVSRKGMIGRMHAASDQGRPAELAELAEVSSVATDDRLEGSLAIAAWCALLGVDIVRVHDVAETVQALKVVAAGMAPRA